MYTEPTLNLEEDMPDTAFASKSVAERQRHFIDRSGIVGKKIVGVQYLSDKETEEMGWYKKGVILVLDDGKQVFVQSDDEGNDAGMLVVVEKNGTEHPLPNF
jgi:hypothetical protein